MFFKALVVAALAFLLVGCSASSKKVVQHTLHAAELTTIAIDYKQSRYIARHPDTYYETNGILGKHPSLKRVDTYFLSCFMLNEIIYWTISDKYKNTFTGSIFIMEMSYVKRNANLGIKISY